MNEKNLEHYCSYFEQSNNQLKESESKCNHEKKKELKTSIKQETCLKCEFKNELMDSLDHLAFLSPDLDQKSKLKFNLFLNKLKFDSPTLLPAISAPTQEEKEEDKSEKSNSLNETKETYLSATKTFSTEFNKTSPILNKQSEEGNDPFKDDATDLDQTSIDDANETKQTFLTETTDNEIINDSITNEESVVNESVVNESISDYNESNMSICSFYSNSSHSSQHKRFKSLNESSNQSRCSETSLALSDSDYDDDTNSMYESFIRRQEHKSELKRKRALDEFEHINKQNFLESKAPKRKRVIKKKDSSNLVSNKFLAFEIEDPNMAWYCPYIEPPRPSDLTETFKVSNEPIVKYYKTKEKYKVVNKGSTFILFPFIFF